MTPIPNYPNYAATKNGQIYSIKNQLFLKNTKKQNKYFIVSMHQNGKQKTEYVHRLIALTFIPNKQNKPQINHINGIKTDNRVENLEWATSKENMHHARTNGLLIPVSTNTRGNKRKDNKSGFVGVNFYKKLNKFRSYILVNRKQFHLGYFETAEEAAKSYDQASLKYHGETGRLNFPI